MTPLERLSDKIRGCSQCALRTAKVSPVPGAGPLQCSLLIIGRNPGEEENKYGRPFIGKAGHRLNEMLDTLHIDRDDCYITNAVKCFTPGNAVPPRPCAATCSAAWLEKELYLIFKALPESPLLLVLGDYAQRVFSDLVAGESPVVAWLRYLQSASRVKFLLHPSAALREPIYEARLRQQTQELATLLANLRVGGAQGKSR